MPTRLSILRSRSGEPMPDSPGDVVEPAEMTLQEHLEELRQRILYCALATGAGAVVGFIAAFPLIDLMLYLTGLGALHSISPTESFMTYMWVAIYIGIALAMPVIVYQLIAFLSPGLTPTERRFLNRAIPFVSGLFVSGMLFAFFVVAPRALRWLDQFGERVFVSTFRAEEVISFYVTLVLAMGLAFQLPVVIILLVRLGIASADRLASVRRYVLILTMIAAAIITPTPDPFTMLFVSMPMYALYEVGLVIARMTDLV